MLRFQDFGDINTVRRPGMEYLLTYQEVTMAKWEYRILEYEVKGGIIPFTENQGRLSRIHLILKKG